MNRPLAQMDRFHRHNRAPAWAPRLGDAPVALAAVLGIGCACLLAAHVLRTLHAVHDGLALASLLSTAAWLGVRIARWISEQYGAVVFRDWLHVLPIPASSLLLHWRRTSLCRAAVAGTAVVPAWAAATHLAGMGMVPGVLAGGVLAATLVGTLALVLRAPPHGHAHAGSAPSPGTAAWWSRFDSTRMPHVGVWQLQRHWRRGALLLFVTASIALLAFAIAWGHAQATAWPVLMAGLLLATAVFNRSFDCTLLRSPTIRMLPLSALHKVSALMRLPVQLSLVILLAALALASAVGRDGISTVSLVQMAFVIVVAWMLLMLLRVTACVSYPGGGIGMEVRYLAQLLACAMLMQALELLGIAAVFAAALFWLRHAIRRLP